MIAKYCSAALAALMLSGCADIKQTFNADLHHTGGGVGYIADQHTPYKTTGIAQPKHMIIYRSIVGTALIAKVAEATIKDPDEADAFVNYLTATVSDINDLAGHIKSVQGQSCDDLLSAHCGDYEFLFESDQPKLEDHMIRMGVASLPRQEASKFLQNVTTGNPLGIATSVWSLGKKIIIAGHNAAATERTEREIFGAIINGGHTVPGNSVDAAIGYIRDHPEAAENFSITPGKIEPFYLILRDVCRHLPLKTGDAMTRQSACNNGIAFVPTTDRYTKDPFAPAPGH